MTTEQVSIEFLQFARSRKRDFTQFDPSGEIKKWMEGVEFFLFQEVDMKTLTRQECVDFMKRKIRLLPEKDGEKWKELLKMYEGKNESGNTKRS